MLTSLLSLQFFQTGNVGTHTVNALKINYCQILFSGLPDNILAQLQSIWNTAVNLLTKTKEIWTCSTLSKKCIFWQSTWWVWNFLIGEQVSTTLWQNWSFLCSLTHGTLHSPLGIFKSYFWSRTWALYYSVENCPTTLSFPGI